MLDLLLDASAVGKVNRKAKSEGGENTKFSYFCTLKLRHFRVFSQKLADIFQKCALVIILLILAQ